ncbi:hypothetical protein LCGC14_2091330 [marine sediment metagenome]|uniref:Uncharacterized protein n=1 Tax=marine sediment metagenome TaxID=412755 RepID=A0A0F9F023_9ZZZZ
MTEEIEPQCLVPVWLLWTMNERNVIGLRGIATNSTTAHMWRKTLLSDPGIVRVWIDRSQLDHLYARNLTELLAYRS